jgi:hemolysin activation/secretion protein
MSQNFPHRDRYVGRFPALLLLVKTQMCAAMPARLRNKDMLIHSSLGASVRRGVTLSLLSLFASGVVQAADPVVPGVSVQQASSLRDVFGINAPDDQPDADEDYRQRSRQKDLMPSTDGDIPDINDRDAGPRILVNKFAFERLEEFPEFGITREGVLAEAERLRIVYMKEDQRGDAGYTPDELREITAYLRDIGSDSDVDDLTHEDMQALIELIRDQKRSRGLSFADLEEIANLLTIYYRKRGLFLARVLLPAQEVENGVVTFTVMEGRLGQLEALGNERYSEELLESPLEHIVGGIVTSQQVEEALYILNDLPGMTLTGAFSAGNNPGETRLRLVVREEDDFSYLVRFDNHGARFTGKARAYGNMQWHNPAGIGDNLSIGLLRSEDIGQNDSGDGLADEIGTREAHSNLGQISYSLPVFNLRNRVTISADRNTFDLVDEDGGIINALEISGVNTTYALRYDYQIRRTRDFNMSTGLAVTDKTSTVESYIDFLSTEDHVVAGEWNFYIDGLSQSGIRMLNTANLRVQYGSFQTDVVEGADENYVRTAIDTSSLFFIPLPFTEKYSRLLTSVRLQHTDQSLPSFEQFSMGGSTGVRGFQVGDFSADKSAFISNEWYFDLPEWNLFGRNTLNDVFQAGILFDLAYGIQNGGFITDSGTLAEDEWAQMSAAGLVFKATWGSTFSSKVSVATPVYGKSSLDPQDGDASTEPLNNNPDAIEVFADINFYF